MSKSMYNVCENCNATLDVNEKCDCQDNNAVEVVESELMIVEQIPIISERLKQLKENNLKAVETVLNMVCNEDTVKVIKKERANLNKLFISLEEKRKIIKSQILAPYEEFESVYKENVTDIFKPSDLKLKQRIDDIESTLINEKTQKFKEYFDEYKESIGILDIDFSEMDFKITKALSEKKGLEAINTYLNKIKEDMDFIATLEDSSETLVEYKKTKNIALAIRTVSEHKKAILIEQERQKQRESELQAQQTQATTIEQIAQQQPTTRVIPKKNLEPTVAEKEYKMTFTVTATKDKLIELKQFMIERGFKYE